MLAYLDYAATSPLRPEALAAMLPFLGERFGNPAGSHSIARDARRALEDARDSIAFHLGCTPGELVFTGGGTESANLAVRGVCSAMNRYPVCSAIEHHAVLRPTHSIGGFSVPVGVDGIVDMGALAAALGPEVGIVSIMLVNNEVGVLQPLDDVAALMSERAPEAVLHTDAVQAVSWLDIKTAAALANLVSLSAHKFGGPKGVGALVVRSGTPLSPILTGGSQERDRRPGTQDVASVVGMAAALDAAVSTREDDAFRVAMLRDRLMDGLVASVPDTLETGVSPGIASSHRRSHMVPGICHLRFPGVDQEELLVLLDQQGVCASAGAACASGAVEPSHVLLAMGLDGDDARSAVRFSLGHDTTVAEVDHALAVVPEAVARLRGSQKMPPAK